MIITPDHIRILGDHVDAMGLDLHTVHGFLGQQTLVDLPGSSALASELTALTETTFTVSPVVYKNIPNKYSFKRTPLTYQLADEKDLRKALRKYMPDWVEPAPKIFR